MPAFLISCMRGKPLHLVGAESVKAFEVAFRKKLHEAGVFTGAGSKTDGKASGDAAEKPAKAAAEE